MIWEMKTLPPAAAGKVFDEWWNELKTEWFKIEVLQDYSGEDDSESLHAWLAGDEKRSIKLIKETYSREWVKQCQEKISAGVKLTRIHIVEEKFSPYLEWEFEYYKQINIPLCGEKVFLCKKNDLQNIDIPNGDVMIFDLQKIVKNTYTAKGKMIEQTFHENENIDKFLELREELLKRSTPLREF